MPSFGSSVIGDEKRAGARGLRTRTTDFGALLRRAIADDLGQDIIEYALLAAAISVVAIPTVPTIGSAVNNAYDDVKSKVTGMPGAGS